MSYNSLFSFVSFRRPEEFVPNDKLEPSVAPEETDDSLPQHSGRDSRISETSSENAAEDISGTAGTRGVSEHEREKPSTELLDRFVNKLRTLDAEEYDSWGSVKIDVPGSYDTKPISLKEYWRSNDQKIAAERKRARRALLNGKIDPSSWEARALRAAALLSTGRRIPHRVFREYIHGRIRSGTKPSPPDFRTNKPQQIISKRHKRLSQIMERLKKIREAKDRVRHVRRNLNLARAKKQQTIRQKQGRTFWQRLAGLHSIDFVRKERPLLITNKIIVRGLLGNDVLYENIEDDVVYKALRRELGSEVLNSILSESHSEDGGRGHETHLHSMHSSDLDAATAVSTAEMEISGITERAYGERSAQDVLDFLDQELDEDVCTLIREANDLKYKQLTNDPSEGEDTPSESTFDTLAPRHNYAIRLAGVGDLITVEEQLKRYVTGEISHIANTISGVTRKRRHVFKVSDEEVVETFRLTEEEARSSLETNTRTELTTTASETAREQFGIRAGVTASGRYGTTQVEASMDASYQRKRSESNSIAQSMAKEVISKTEERTKTVQRELRRSVSKRESTEENKETFKGEETTSHLYVWLEQEREVRLLNKGSRVFTEFYVPEPAIDLRKPTKHENRDQLPPPFQLSVADISEHNYMAYASLYRARDIKPPPPEYTQQPFGLITKPDESAGSNSEDVIKESITVKAGYVPDRLRYKAHGRSPYDRVAWFIAIDGQLIFRDYPEEDENGINPVVGLETDGDLEVELNSNFLTTEGSVLNVVVAGHHDKAATLSGTLICKRACESYADWQLETFNALSQAHQNMVEEYERVSAGFGLQREEMGGPASQNRETEQRELRKWCKQLMGVTPPSESAYEPGNPWSVLDPNIASEQSFLSEFLDSTFEWQEMTYFLLDYDVAPVSRWSAIRGSYSSDPRHTDFLQAGAARVLVPITPKFETVIAQYMRSHHVPTAHDIGGWLSGRLDDEDGEALEADSNSNSSGQQSSPDDVRNEDINLLLELLVARNPDVVMGSGRLSLENENSTAKVIDSLWKPDHIDKGRRIYIEDSDFIIQDVGEQSDLPVLTLDKVWNGETRDDYNFAIEAVQVGDSWTITLPTQLIMLFDSQTKKSLENINAKLDENLWPEQNNDQ